MWELCVRMCCGHSVCQVLRVDTLEGLLDIGADSIDNVIHNVTYVRPNGIVSNVSRQGQCFLLTSKPSA